MSSLEHCIAEAHADDVSRARALIGTALAQATQSWIPANAVAAALTAELVALDLRLLGADATARHLRSIVLLLESGVPGGRPS